MRKKYPPMRVRSFVRREATGELVEVASLSEEERRKVGIWIRLTELESRFGGIATFSVADDDGPHIEEAI